MEYGTARCRPGIERWLALGRGAPPPDRSVHAADVFHFLGCGGRWGGVNDVAHPHLRGAVAVRAVAGGRWLVVRQ